MVNTAGMDELPYGNSSMPAVFTMMHVYDLPECNVISKLPEGVLQSIKFFKCSSYVPIQSSYAIYPKYYMKFIWSW